MGLYGVWVQPITDETNPDNVAKYGEVIDVEAVYEQDTGNMSRDFCDGQTSPLGPRYADDQMGTIYFESREAAMYASGVLRSDVAARAAAGELAGVSIPGQWAAITVLQPATTAALIESIRQAAEIPATITDSQIQAQISKYANAAGAIPDADDMIDFWTINPAPWM